DTGASGDLIYAEEGDDYLVGGIDQDLMQGGSGDDILRPGTPSQASGTVGGPDEVVGDDGIGNVGFDLIDLSDYAAGAPGVVIDLSTQANPLVAIDAISPFPAWFEVEGAIGTQNGDTFIGDSLGDATAANSLGGNWLIGGSGNDTFTGKGGNDLIVGGSIRLDQLIGTYADAATAEGPGNLVLGSAEWLADAMQTGISTTSGNEGYDKNSEDAYSGTSNRATGALSGGLLAGAGFDPHFTEMLRSRMFKDVVLGDNGIDGTADTAVFTGNRADYTIVGLDSAGLVTNVEADIFALKISDTRDPNAVDVDGVLIPTDGVDLVVGVETLKFNGSIAVNVAENAAGPIASINGFGTTTYSLTGPDAGLFAINQTTGELTFVNAPNFEAPGDVGADNVYNVTVNSTGAVSFAQNVVVTVTNIDEAGSNAINITAAEVTTPTTVTLTGLNVVNDADVPITPLYVWSNGATTAQTVVTATAAIQTITLSGGYTDAFGVNPLLGAAPVAPQTAIIGTVGNNVGNNVNTGALNGTVGADFMIGLAGNDTYVVNDVGDVVVEALSSGTDAVLTSLTSYTLTANVENLTFNNGNAADVDFSATGNALANTLTGGSANDTFNMIVDDVRDNVRGGDGVDTADYSAYTTNLTVTLNATVNTDVAVGGSGSANGTRDLIRSIENFVGGSGNDVITGAAGDNALSGSAGDDTLNYSVTTQGVGNTLTSGRDFIDGGDSTTVGDRFVLNGNNQGEAFQIISRTDPANAVLLASLNVTFNANTEIVVTRNGVVIAELDNIEEITINNQAVTTGGGNTAGQGADSVAIVGNFSGTSLALNTITINGGLGSDTVDISGLTSDHRIVFNTNGANDQVVGTVRPQDIVGGYSEGTTDPTTIVEPDCYMFGPAPQLDQDDDRTIEQTSFVAENGVLIGNDNNNILVGDENVQAILANAGDDVVRAGDAATVVDAGNGADVVDGSGHEDILIGGLGDDLLDGRAGADKIWGEQGSDIIFGGDGDDIVFGGSGEDELHGGAGTDRLEGGRDADALWGGADDDVFVFRTTQDANGDVVSDFTPGDRIDLHFIDADQATTANDAFIIVTGTTFTGAGELIVRFDASNNQTFVEGNTDSNVATAEFQLAFSGDQVNQLKADGIIH
ncbi:MAG: calcium-binding protein, partial [Hyphomicrobiaceae bacterium]